MTIPAKILLKSCRCALVCFALVVGAAISLRAQATWTLRDSGTTANLWAATSGAGVIVVVGEQGTILTSADGGMTWTRRDSGTTAWLTSVTYSPTLRRYFTVGEAGAIHSSSDAITWMRESSPTTARLNGVGEANGLILFAVGEAGTGLLSRDDSGAWTRSDAEWGDRWMKGSSNLKTSVLGQGGAFRPAPNLPAVPLPTISDLEDGATGAPPGTPDFLTYSTSVLVGADGTILQKEKNGSWTSRSSGTRERLRGVCWKTGAVVNIITLIVRVDIGEYFAVGARGTILRSRDGTEWLRDLSPTTNNLNAVLANGASVIAVGDRGTILQTGGAVAAPKLTITTDNNGLAHVGVTGAGMLTYYRLRNSGGAPTPLSYEGKAATDFTLAVVELEIGSPTSLIIANAFGSTSPYLAPVQSFHNLSARATVGPGEQTLIGGISITPGASRTMLIRAVGPTLANFGLSAPLAKPRLTLFSGADVIATNASWSTAANSVEVREAARSAGSFPLPDGSADAAMLLTLLPGNYTAQVTSADGSAGTALLEVYDVGPARFSHLKNLSTRAQVQSGDGVLIGGLVVDGDMKKNVLLRAAGPALTGFGLQGVLARPKLTVFHGNFVIATAVAWSAAPNAAALALAAKTIGAFAFPAGSADAALLLELEPGAYTLQVTGADGGGGVALVEAYEYP